MDNETIHTKAIMVTISNGPFTGAALKMAPSAKLNDHRLTVSLFNMSKLQLLKYFIDTKRNEKNHTRKVKTYQTEKVTLITSANKNIHADARLFGATPAEFKVVPNALVVITGFPKPGEDSALTKRTMLDP